MTDDALAAKMQALIDRNEILDVLHRYSRGMDRQDRELARSVYHDDAIDVHGSHRVRGRGLPRLGVRVPLAPAAPPALRHERRASRSTATPPTPRPTTSSSVGTPTARHR